MRTAKKHLVIENTLSASFNSDAIDLEHMVYLNVSSNIVTPDATGTFVIQTRNYSDENWVEYSGSSVALIGANKDIVWNISDIGFRYARVAYTRTGGGGAGTTCDIRVNMKGINA